MLKRLRAICTDVCNLLHMHLPLFFNIYIFKSFTVLLVSAIQQNVLFSGKQNPEQTPTPTTKQNNRGTLSCNSSHVGIMTASQLSEQGRDFNKDF